MLRKGIAICLIVFLFCIGIESWAQEKSPNRVTSERLIAHIDPSLYIPGSFTESPDSKQVAYTARVGKKQFVVVDGKEGKQYDKIGEGTPIFSPDSKRVAYAAKVGKKCFVVVDGKEGKRIR